MSDTLTFPNNDGVGGVPTIDGFFDLDYMITGETPDTGYIEGSQMTFGDGGIAPVVFRGIRNSGNGRIVMAFMCRMTGTFSTANRVIIALKPSFGVNNIADYRMIEIAPVDDGIGSDTGVGSGPPHNIKTNIDPTNPPATVNLEVFFRRGQANAGFPSGIEWVEYNTQTNTDIRVRSWTPDHTGTPESAWSIEIEVPTDAADGGPDWITLTNDFGFYFSVIEIVPVSPAMATEYVFPLGAPEFLSLLTFDPQFGHGLLPPIAAGAAQGISFVGDWQGVGRRPENSGSLTLSGEIEAEVNGSGDDQNNELVALLENSGSVDATGVTAEFRLKNYGLPPADFNLWDRPNGLQPNPTAGATINTGATNVALVSDWPIEPVNEVPAGYQARTHQCMWVQLDSSGTASFAQSSMRRNMNIETLSSIDQSAEVSGEGYEEPMNGTGEHDFVLQTFGRKLIIPELIENQEQADEETLRLASNAIIGSQQTKPDGDNVTNPDVVDRVANRDFVATHLTTAARRPVNEYQDTIVHIWVTRGYRLTDKVVTIGSVDYPLLDNGCGSFGVVATHDGIKDPFSWQFGGDGLAQFKPGLYALKVPHKGVTQLRFRLTAERDNRPGDRSDIPRIERMEPGKPWTMGKGGPKPVAGDDGKDKGGCLGLLFAMAAIPAALVAGLFGIGPRG
ncbi:MAG: hypothetical protein QNJ15_04670 [Erythrobacter sp.]|nr:hypothetical protein [Erythrobacter sp.]